MDYLKAGNVIVSATTVMPTRTPQMLTESIRIIVYIWVLVNGAMLTVEGRYMVDSFMTIVTDSLCLSEN